MLIFSSRTQHLSGYRIVKKAGYKCQFCCKLEPKAVFVIKNVLYNNNITFPFSQRYVNFDNNLIAFYKILKSFDKQILLKIINLQFL